MQIRKEEVLLLRCVSPRCGQFLPDVASVIMKMSFQSLSLSMSDVVNVCDLSASFTFLFNVRSLVV